MQTGLVVTEGQMMMKRKETYMWPSGDQPTQSHQSLTYVAYWVLHDIRLGFCYHSRVVTDQCKTVQQ